MKYLIILSLLVSSFCFSQESNSKSQKVSFNVKGVCEMCKDRIEKGTIKLKGVKYVNWDIISNNISLIYNSKKINLDDIHKGISLLGHSTDKYTAPSEIYNNLPDCCMYETLEIH
ncbi:metal transporter [Flavobacteriaceae bacterium]|nr:metal transporter [Flavobacteriaceae bacterium]